MHCLPPKAQIVELLVESVLGRAALLAQEIKRIDAHPVINHFYFGLTVLVQHHLDKRRLSVDRVIDKLLYAVGQRSNHLLGAQVLSCLLRKLFYHLLRGKLSIKSIRKAL